MTGAQAQDRVLRRFDVGSGAAAVGVTPASEDVEATGPSAMYAGDDGTLYLLDQVNGRILGVNADKPATPPKVLDLPEGMAPTDLVSVKDKLYVWDGKAHALENKGQAGDAAPLVARSVGDGDPVTRSAFAQMGSQTLASDAETIAAVGRSLQGQDSSDVSIRQTIATRSKRVMNVEIMPRKDGKSALVELRPQDDPLASIRLVAEVTDRLGSIEVLDVDAQGKVFVFVENVPTSAKGRIGVYVAQYNQHGRLERVYDLPLATDQIGSRRFVTISPGGKVLFLKSDSTGVSIIDLASRGVKKQVLEPPPVKLATMGPLPDYSEDFGPITAVRPNSRMGAIQTGLAFEGLKWQVTPQNYGRDPDIACNGFAGRVRRPWYLDGKAGQEVRGVPYCWGCFGSLLQFKRKVESGAVAGNVCTKDNPRREMAGVDCSAFVSAAWGLSRHYTTMMIPSITKPINALEMKPGDAFNKPGSHVMLFVKFTPDRKVEVLESATGGCKGRVCRNVYPLNALLARGYQPVRYPTLTD